MRAFAIPAGRRTSFPRTSTFSAGLDGSLRLSWPSIPGKTYLVETGNGTGWTLVENVSAAPAPTTQTLLTVEPAANGVVQMFRVKVAP